MLKGIQILGILIGFYLISRTILNYYRKIYDFKRVVFWLFLWVVMIGLFYEPSFMLAVTPYLTTMDAIMSITVISIIFLFVLIANIYQKMIFLEKKFTFFVQNVAIKNYLDEKTDESKNEG
jgi:hypothetical protein